jgi:hypothetical protein
MATKKSSNTIAMTKSEDDWQCESDLRTLMEAEKIKNDPKRLAKVQAMAKQKMMAVASIAAEAKDA